MPWWQFVPDPKRISGWLTARPYAHRGLHGSGRIENSRAAFEAAIAKDFGIELDVRAARCGTPLVFHDATLDRLCGIDARLDSMDAAEAGKVRLLGCGEPIPTLAEICDLVAGRAPLLVEIKARCHLGLLTRYKGPVAIMSFDPRLIADPELMRGLVISEEGKSGFKGAIERNLAVWRSRPDFLAYDVRSLPSRFAARWRQKGRPVLSWTVRSDGDARTALSHADQIIHEWDGAA